MDFNKELENCNSIGEIFELVKEICKKYTGEEQAGIMVGLSDMGKYPNGFLGAFYSPMSNMIVINKRIIPRIQGYVYKDYMFHILLHEYVHSLGHYDEEETRAITLAIASELGNETIVKLATDMSKFFPEIVLSNRAEEPKDIDIEFVTGIDRKNISYIG
jgi:hypothetical protein